MRIKTRKNIDAKFRWLRYCGYTYVHNYYTLDGRICKKIKHGR